MDPVTEAGVHKSLGELHAKVDLLLSRDGDYGRRIDKLSRAQWVIGGGWAAFVLFVGPRIFPLLNGLPH